MACSRKEAGPYRGVSVLNEQVLLLIPHSIQADDCAAEAKQLAYLHSGQGLPVNNQEQEGTRLMRVQTLSVLPL